MKTRPFFAMIAAGLLALGMNLHSQAPLPKSPVEQLKAVKAKNMELIEKQKATLLKLDEMEKQAEQMRFFSKRG